MFTELHQFIIIIDEWEKILLYAGNFSISSPILLSRLGKIYLTSSEQSAGNFTFSQKAKAITKNTYKNYINLPKIKILFNFFKINSLQSHHTAVPNQLNFISNLLNPNFVTGFIDAEGCFIIKIRENSKAKFSWSLEAIFVIGLHKKYLTILKLLQIYF